MDEPYAWLEQADSDREAAESHLQSASNVKPCHAIAKYQQAVEKAVKALVAELRDRGIIFVKDASLYRHEVEPFANQMVRLPHPKRDKDLSLNLRCLLDSKTRSEIGAIDALTPRRPLPGQPSSRNTEYPFPDPQNGWIYPAAPSVFTPSEVQRFRGLSHRIVTGARRIISAIRRAPK